MNARPVSLPPPVEALGGGRLFSSPDSPPPPAGWLDFLLEAAVSSSESESAYDQSTHTYVKQKYNNQLYNYMIVVMVSISGVLGGAYL